MCIILKKLTKVYRKEKKIVLWKLIVKTEDDETVSRKFGIQETKRGKKEPDHVEMSKVILLEKKIQVDKSNIVKNMDYGRLMSFSTFFMVKIITLTKIYIPLKCLKSSFLLLKNLLIESRNRECLRCGIFGFCLLSFPQNKRKINLVCHSLYIFWEKCVCFFIFECRKCQIDFFDIIVNFIIQKLKSKHNSLKNVLTEQN